LKHTSVTVLMTSTMTEHGSTKYEHWVTGW